MEGATITLKLTDDFFCPDCQRLFDKPKVLVCGHSVCQKCLRQRCANIPPEKNEITCPKCKCGVLIPSSGVAEDFPDNYSMVSVLSVLKSTPEVQEMDRIIGKNGTRKRLSQTGKEVQRFGQMQKQLEQDMLEIQTITKNAKTAVRALNQSKNYLDKQISDAAESFLTTVTRDTEIQKENLLHAVEESFREKVTESSATLQKAKVMEATIFSAREVTSSILAALEREEADIKNIGVKVEGLVKNVEKKMTEIRKRKIPDVLGVRFQPNVIESTPSFGQLPDLLLFVGVLWVNSNELILVADRRKDRNCVTFRFVNSDDVSKTLWEGEITPSDKEAPITAVTSLFRTGTILVSVGKEVFILGVDQPRPNEPSSIATESVLSLDIPQGTHITSLSVRHDGNIMIGTNLSNMILVFSEDGRSIDVIDILAEDDVMYPISMCSISYYRTAVCCLNAEKVIVLSHSWNAAKTKRADYLTPARASLDDQSVNYVCKTVKSSLSGWLVLWFTSERNTNDKNEERVIWEVVCYEYVKQPVVNKIAQGDSRETGIPVNMDVREKQLAICFPDGRVRFYEM